MENQNQVPQQTQPMTPQVPAPSPTQPPSPKPKDNGKTWKIVSVILASVIVLAILFIAWGFYLIKTKPDLTDNQQQNMPNDLKSQFITFYKDLRVAAGKNDFDFVKKTIPQDQIESLKQLQDMSEEQVIAIRAKDIANIKDDMIVSYDCKDNTCLVTIMWDNDPQNTSKVKYLFSNNNWFSKNDNLPSSEQINTLNNLANEYQISFYRNGNAVFKIYLNGKELESMTVTNPKGETLNMLLFVNSGDNTLEIEIIPTAPGNQQITYSYNLYQFPKGAGQYAIFNDEYKLATSDQPGEIVSFVKLTLTKTEKIEIPFTAK